MKLFGLKSHDCHVLMQQLLSIAICRILPNKVRVAITRLCLMLSVAKSLTLNNWIFLCQLEMYFSPSFFDIMIHLIVHLVREIQLCGPIFFFFYGGCIQLSDT